MNEKKIIREKFRQAVFSRDGFKCQVCGIIENLDAHHITSRKEMPNGGYVKENGITLCQICHCRAEIALQWFNKFRGTDPEYPCPTFDGPIDYLPDTLYKMIDSNHLKAEEVSAKI
jgi:hypothetical protein